MMISVPEDVDSVIKPSLDNGQLESDGCSRLMSLDVLLLAITR